MSGFPRPEENSEDEDSDISSGGSAGEEDIPSLRQEYDSKIALKARIKIYISYKYIS